MNRLIILSAIVIAALLISSPFWALAYWWD